MRLSAKGEYGFDDPADTGMVCGMLAPWLYSCPPGSKVSLDLYPVFGRACLSGALDATVEVTPASLIPPVWRFAWHAFGPLRP